MCGIVGIVSNKPIVERLIEGLARLEYRGYDSAGIGVLNKGELAVRRASGKLESLRNLLQNSPIEGQLGIGHTRWATHGEPTLENAHPHSNGRVSVVHNGIIENHGVLKHFLQEKGYTFTSQTDTETVVHLMSYYLDQNLSSAEAFRKTLQDIEGAFALGIMVTGDTNLYFARNGSPLVLGNAENEYFLGSDIVAIGPWATSVQYLEDGDYGFVNIQGIYLYDKNHHSISRPSQSLSQRSQNLTKGSYNHFMLKEIFEQPNVILDTLEMFLNLEKTHLRAPFLSWDKVDRLTIVACGTSFYAASVAKYWIESLAGLPVQVDIASEFRYRNPVFMPREVGAVISQSGETIDTLKSMSLFKEKNIPLIGIVNVETSSIARQSDHVIHTQAGPEIGVASTKAFVAQLISLACLALQAGLQRGKITEAQGVAYVEELRNLPTLVHSLLQKEQDIAALAQSLKNQQSMLYLGRGTSYPIALEGALKIKELSYIHAEGCAAGEIKHGPIALVDKDVPVIILAPNDSWLVKVLSNMQEVIARGAQAICFTDKEGASRIREENIKAQVFEMPATGVLSGPIAYTVPMQLLAYYTSLARGNDVDQPRNLAKSVTVE